MKNACQVTFLSFIALLIISGCGHPGFNYVDTAENIQDSVFESHRSEIEAFIQNTISGIPFEQDFKAEILSDSITDELSEKLFSEMIDMPDSLDLDCSNCLFLTNSKNVSMFGVTNSVNTKNGYSLKYFEPAKFGKTKIDPMGRKLSVLDWYQNPNQKESFPDSVEAARKKIIIAKKEQQLSELNSWKYVAVINDVLYTPAELEGDDSFISAGIVSTVKLYDYSSKELLFSSFIIAENKEEVATINMQGVPGNLADGAVKMTLQRDICTQRNLRIFELFGWEE